VTKATIEPVGDPGLLESPAGLSSVTGEAEHDATRPAAIQPNSTLLVAAMLGAALLVSGMLISGGPAAKGAKNQAKNRRAVVSSVFVPGRVYAVSGLLRGKQNGATRKRGTRPMGIIAVLIGLKSGKRYSLQFSTETCAMGKCACDGVTRKVGKPIEFTASAKGQAFVRQRYKMKRKILRRAKSVGLIEGDPDRPIIVGCGRFDIEDAMDGNDS
jgi:hypothetical protein